MNKYNELISKSNFYKSIIEQKTKVNDDLIENDKSIKLNIGSGPNIFPYKGWINYDRENFSDYFTWLKNINALIPEMSWAPNGPGSLIHLKLLQKFLNENEGDHICIHDLRNEFIQHIDNTIDLIYIGQVIEHLNPIYEAPKLIKECYRMMRSGGVIRLTTPDLDLLIQHYLDGKMNAFTLDQPEFYKTADPGSQLSYIMFGATGPNCTFNNYEGHMFLYNKESMSNLLKSAGFNNIEFYYELGKSKNKIMEKEVVDAGISHSFIVEAVK